MRLFLNLRFYLAYASIGMSAGTFANETIVVPDDQYLIDDNLNLIVSNFSVETINETWPLPKDQVNFSGELFDLEIAVGTIVKGLSYAVYSSVNNEWYQLFFTELPIIEILTTEIIPDEPKVHGTIRVTDNLGFEVYGNVGIEIRGGWSQVLPKKSYRIEFWTNESGVEPLDVTLLGMRNDDDWNLNAMYNEPLRIRSKTNNDLWRLIHEPYYLDLEPTAETGIEVKYAECFINGAYQGVYGLSERVDQKQLQLQEYEMQIRGELYKGVTWGASTFSDLPPYDNASIEWSGFQIIHPSEEINWAEVHGLVDFVMNSGEDVFFAEIGSYFNIDNAVDYFLFLNLLRATDNFGKNIFLAKYDAGEPYFYVPWDLDGSFGTIWDGTQDNTTNTLIFNGLYNRLKFDCADNGFVEKLKFRWNTLREEILTHEFLMSLFLEQHHYLLDNGVYERESMVWTDYSMDPSQVEYMSNWIENRLDYLDIQFNAPCGTMSLGSISENVSEFRIYPNPTCSNFFALPSDKRIIKCEVFSASGKCLYREENPKGIVVTPELSSGLYLVMCHLAEGKVLKALWIRE
jgi:spore coat protein H